jgi:elongation factor Tu
MFEMTVESMFHMPGRGTVLAGLIRSGDVSPGDAVEVRSPTKSCRSIVAGVEVDRKEISSAKIGEKVALLFREFVPDTVSDGLKREGNPPVWQVVNLTLHGVAKSWWKIW